MADQTERLLLQVDAATELLRRHLAEGEQPLDRFERRAAKMAENVEGSIDNMGKRFGAFASLAENAAERTQRSFEASFSQVQRLASTAIKGPTIQGGINLGAEDIRAGAAAAQDQARAFALIGEAAERAALAERDTSEATRLFIQATNASRIEAEQKAAALLAEAGALERVEIELRQSAEATDLFVTKHQRIAEAVAQERQLAASTDEAARSQRALAAAADIVRAELDPMFLAQKRFDDEMNRADTLLAAGVLHQREYAAAVALARGNLNAHAQSVAGAGAGTNALTTNTNALRYAMQGTSYQVQDTFTQISMGANVLQVVAIQGGQLAGQFANIEGKAGSVARFMIGPWGLAITAGLLVLGPLTKGLLDFGDATDDAVDKLKKDAVESDVAARAKARFAGTVEGLTAALKDQDKALKATADSERSSAERANIAARAKRDEALAIRQRTAARLADAEAELGSFNITGATTGAAALQNQGRSDRVNQLRAERTAADAAVAEAQRQLNVTRVDLAAERAAVSIDPVRAVTKAYDDRINTLKREQREQARLGKIVGTESAARLRALEAEKKAAVDAAQDRQRLANAKPNNNQVGRDVGVAEATSIIASIGGRVTNGYRSPEKQRQIYADKLAGRHIGPVAKPGTSDHERGQAVDVAYGPGISIASIRAAFAKQGVAIRQLLDEPTQRIYHVAFGKKGASQESVDIKTERARVKLINDDISFAQQERAAQRRLIEAKGRHATSEEELESLAQSDINAQANAEKVRIAGQLSTKKISDSEATRLSTLNEEARTASLRNLILDRANRQIEQRYDVEQDDLQSRLSLMRIGQDLATTDRQRRQIAFDILATEQELRRKALERVRDTSKDPADVLRAQRSLAALPAQDAGERSQLARQTASPIDQYRDRLQHAAGDMDAALEDVAARGLGTIEDGLAGLVSGTETAGQAFKKMASSILSDLARIAAQKLILSLVGGPAGLAFADGGVVPGFAGGGVIYGPGTGRSDSILARVSAGEGILTAEAVEHYGRGIVTALNSKRLPKFANGGLVSPSLPQTSLRSPRLPAAANGRRSAPQQQGFYVKVDKSDLFDVHVQTITAPLSQAALLGGARMAQDEMAEQRWAQIPG